MGIRKVGRGKVRKIKFRAWDKKLKEMLYWKSDRDSICQAIPIDCGDDWWLSCDALFYHSVTYASFTTLILGVMISLTIIQSLLVLCVLLISHLIIDNRIPVKWIMRLKGCSWDQINDYQNYGFLHIGIS